MNNRLAGFIQIPVNYASSFISDLVRALRGELSRLTAFAATVVWDPAGISTGASTTKTVTVTGVKAGTLAAVRIFSPYTISGLSVSGYVSADDTVTMVLTNNTGGSVNLSSGTWGVAVENFVS